MNRVFYGWYVVAAAFGITFIGFGTAYTFSAFFEPLTREFGASRASVSLVFALAGFLYFALGVISGPLADRFGPRRMAMLGMILLGLGLILAGAAQSLTQVFLAYGLGVGFGVGCAYVPVVGVVQRWFERRRGMASGLAVSGIGAGTLVMPPLAVALIEWMGWRDAYIVIGTTAAIIGAALGAVMVGHPSERGLVPDGQTSSFAHVPAKTIGIREAVRTRQFIGLYAGCLLCGLGVFIPFVHLVPDARDRGIDPTTAALLISFIGVGSTLGRFVLGSMADRVGRDRFLLSMYFGLAVAMLLWATASGVVSLIAFALIFGALYGGWVAILPAAVMDRFGGANVSGIIGILYTSVALGTLAGPVAAGYLHDATGSYFQTIVVSACANLAAAAVTALAQRTPKPCLGRAKI